MYLGALMPYLSGIFILFLVGVGIELRALSLKSRCSASTIPSVYFALVILEMGVSLFVQAGFELESF
jgi:hypothetical protein